MCGVHKISGHLYNISAHRDMTVDFVDSPKRRVSVCMYDYILLIIIVVNLSYYLISLQCCCHGIVTMNIVTIYVLLQEEAKHLFVLLGSLRITSTTVYICIYNCTSISILYMYEVCTEFAYVYTYILCIYICILLLYKLCNYYIYYLRYFIFCVIHY